LELKKGDEAIHVVLHKNTNENIFQQHVSFIMQFENRLFGDEILKKQIDIWARVNLLN